MDIYVKVEYYCFDAEHKPFETADDACDYAQQKSKNMGVNYCKVYIGGYLQRTYDGGTRV